jgi:hypothetical protein
MSYRSRRLNCSKRSLSSVQIRWAVDFDSFPARPSRTTTRRRASTGRAQTRRSPSPSRARCAAASCRAGSAWRRTARPPRGPGGSLAQAGPRRSAPCGRESRCAPSPIVAQPSLILGSALIPSPPQPGLELVLHSTLDDRSPPPGDDDRAALVAAADERGQEAQAAVTDEAVGALFAPRSRAVLGPRRHPTRLRRASSRRCSAFRHPHDVRGSCVRKGLHADARGRLRPRETAAKNERSRQNKPTPRTRPVPKAFRRRDGCRRRARIRRPRRRTSAEGPLLSRGRGTHRSVGRRRRRFGASGRGDVLAEP